MPITRRLSAFCVHGLLLLCTTSLAWAAPARPDPAAALRTQHGALTEQLQRNPFGRPLVLASTETPNRLTGEIHAVLDYPFAQVDAALTDPGHWCDVISLHVNTKYCRASNRPAGPGLRVHIGKKTPQELAEAARVDFAYRVAAETPEYVDIVLDTREGPVGTSDYRIQLEAVALPNAKTFIHLTYSYAFNFAGRLAMQTYLGTLARDKVGFTQTAPAGGGQGGYVGGLRGLVERNAMRYYLAIDAFMDAAARAPAAQQFETRLQHWFAATEQYPRQLHEVEREDYLAMKRAENTRQNTVN